MCWGTGQCFFLCAGGVLFDNMSTPRIVEYQTAGLTKNPDYADNERDCWVPGLKRFIRVAFSQMYMYMTLYARMSLCLSSARDVFVFFVITSFQTESGTWLCG